MVDTKDLKSFGPYRLCGFESRFLHGYHFTDGAAPGGAVF